jgi:hypothetical protein
LVAMICRRQLPICRCRCRCLPQTMRRDGRQRDRDGYGKVGRVGYTYQVTRPPDNDL